MLKHNNGNIRHAAIRMFKTELGPLTYHIRFPCEKSSSLDISLQLADNILLALFISINNLMADFWKTQFKSLKYISSLQAGVYKSFQLLLSRFEDLCGEKYLEQLRTREEK